MKRSYVRSLLSLGFLWTIALTLVAATEAPASAYNDCNSSDCIN